jgi:hypothetical protein
MATLSSSAASSGLDLTNGWLITLSYQFSSVGMFTEGKNIYVLF